MPKPDRSAILDAVHELPPDERLEIAREILITSDAEQAEKYGDSAGAGAATANEATRLGR